MLEYLEPRALLPVATLYPAALTAYWNTTLELLPAYLSAASSRRLLVERGELFTLSRCQREWVSESGKRRPYYPRTAFQVPRRYYPGVVHSLDACHMILLTPQCQVEVVGTTSQILPTPSAVVDIITNVKGIYALCVDGQVLHSRTVFTSWSSTTLFDGQHFSEFAIIPMGFSNRPLGLCVGVTLQGELAVKGTYRGTFYPSFTPVPWPN
jgi:hypothetical protein